MDLNNLIKHMYSNAVCAPTYSLTHVFNILYLIGKSNSEHITNSSVSSVIINRPMKDDATRETTEFRF